MTKYLAAILVLALSAVAQAQTVPPTGQLYFVGAPEDLLVIRAALTHLMSDQSLAHGLTGFDSSTWTSPHTDEPGDSRMFPPPIGLGEVDCMAAYYGGPEQAWNNGSGMYMGQSAYVDGVLVDVPEAETLVDPENLPQVCKDWLLDGWCGPNRPSFFSEMMCSWGDTWCCTP